VAGDPNSIVSDAAESRTKVTKFLIFVFIEHYDFLEVFSGISRYEPGAPQRGGWNFYTLCLIVQTTP
jgi:hypothetical protein